METKRCQDCGAEFSGGKMARFCKACRKRHVSESSKRRRLCDIGARARQEAERLEKGRRMSAEKAARAAKAAAVRRRTWYVMTSRVGREVREKRKRRTGTAFSRSSSWGCSSSGSSCAETTSSTHKKTIPARRPGWALVRASARPEP